VPRAGLSREGVFDRAQAIADAHGLEALDLTALASACGVRKPSLYKHVDGLPDLLSELAARGYEGLRAAVDGEATTAGAARAWRRFAQEHPGLYAAAVPRHTTRSGRAREAAEAALAVLLDRLRQEGLGPDDAVHAARALRSLIHGFVELERAGGFGLAAPVDESFERALAALLAGLGLGSPSGGPLADGSAQR